MTSLLQEDKAVRIAAALNIPYDEALAWVLEHPEQHCGLAGLSVEGRWSKLKVVWITNGKVQRRFVRHKPLPQGWRYGVAKKNALQREA